MDAIKIVSGEKRIPLERDGVVCGELVFNPSDATFVERFYRLLQDVSAKADEYKNMDVDAIKDDDIGAFMKIVRDSNNFMRSKIDYVFGEGTSKMAFGDVVSPDFGVYFQFIEGVKPYIASARAGKIEKYIPNVRKPVTGLEKPKKPRKRK